MGCGGGESLSPFVGLRDLDNALTMPGQCPDIAPTQPSHSPDTVLTRPRHGLRRSTRRTTKRAAATAAIHAYQVTRPPRSELEYFRAISYINSMVESDSRAGACGGGLALGMTEFAYPLVSRSGLEPPAGLREETP